MVLITRFLALKFDFRSYLYIYRCILHKQFLTSLKNNNNNDKKHRIPLMI